MKVVILNSEEQVADYGAQVIEQQINTRPESVLGLATGTTPLALYRLLVGKVDRGEMSFRKVSTFNLDEYLGLSGDHPQSYRFFMNQHLFGRIDIDPANTHVPDGSSVNPRDAALNYERRISAAGGIDLQLLGIGRNGHIGFNEPSSSLASRTRVKTLTAPTIADNARFFSDDEFQPHLCITMGIGTILDAKDVILMATGTSKAMAIKATIEGPVSANCPASALQLHPSVTLIIDDAAASELGDPEFFRHIERENRNLLTKYDV